MLCQCPKRVWKPKKGRGCQIGWKIELVPSQRFLFIPSKLVLSPLTSINATIYLYALWPFTYASLVHFHQKCYFPRRNNCFCQQAVAVRKLLFGMRRRENASTPVLSVLSAFDCGRANCPRCGTGSCRFGAMRARGNGSGDAPQKRSGFYSHSSPSHGHHHRWPQTAKYQHKRSAHA